MGSSNQAALSLLDDGIFLPRCSDSFLRAKRGVGVDHF